MISMDELATVFVDAADTLVDDFDLVDFLHGVVNHTATITNSQAVGLMLADQSGELRFMASSTEDARLLELLQIQNAEGPCLDCHRTGREVVHDDLTRAADRWPGFAPRAVALGFTAVHALPMRLRDHTIGAVNVFRHGGGPLGADEARVARALTDVATIALIQQRAITRAEVLTSQLQGALNSRIVIEQAKGALARSFDIGVDEAFDVLRGHARRTQQRLTDVARDMVADSSTIDALRATGDLRAPE